MDESQKQEIRELVQSEIRSVFEQLTNDVSALKKGSEKQGQALNRIERCLLGDDAMQDVGFAKMINESYEYVRKSKENKIMEKAEVALDFFYLWKKEHKWEELDQMIKDNFVSGRVKAWFNVGSWAGIIGLILSIVSVLTLLRTAGVL